MFEKAIDLLDEYYRLTEATGDPAFNKSAASEVRKRLKQLDRLLRLVAREEAIIDGARNRMGEAMERRMEELRLAGKSWEDPHPPGEIIDRADGRVSIDAMEDLELYTEAFYYLAERARTIMKQNKPSPLPGIGDPGHIGIAQVRHGLLEHYSPDGRLAVGNSFAVGGKQGPILKPVTQDGVTPPTRDAGLYVNAEEFATRLERQFQAATEKLIGH